MAHVSRSSALLYSWLPLAAGIFIICGLVYGAVQFDLRSGANDPQIQMAEDLARSLESGQTASSLVPINTPMDVSKTLAPFVVIYDDTANPIAANGQLNGQAPTPPQGVFQFAANHGEDRLTWQPQTNLRFAAVMVRVTGNQPGFVLVARSLHEVEKREDNMFGEVIVAGIIALAASFILAWLVAPLISTKR